MNNFILVFILGIAVGGVVFWKCRKKSSFGQDGLSSDKDSRRAQIMALFETKNKITNNDVESLLGVSDATATRYLQELEDKQRIKQIGREGAFVYYIRL